MMQYNWRK